MKKTALMLILSLMLLFASQYASAQNSAYDMSDITFGEPISYGPVLFNTNLVKGTYAIQDGKPIGLTVVPGYPTYLNIVNLNTMELIEAIEVPNAHSACWMNDTNKFGDVYFGSYTKAHFYKYSPAEKKLYDLGAVKGESAVISMCFDDDGNPWLGTYPHAKIMKYDISTEKFIDYGRMHQNDQYVNALAYYKGKCYYQLHNNNEGLYVFNPDTGENSIIPFKANTITGAAKVFVRENMLVLMGTSTEGKGVLMFYDLEKEQWGEMIGKSVKGQYVTPVLDGKLYYLDSGCVNCYDMETGSVEAFEDMTYGSYLRGNGFFEVDDPEMPGMNYFNIQYNGQIQLWNFQTHKIKIYSGMLKGVASETRDYEFGPDGRLYVGEYMGTKAAALNLKTKEIEYFHMAQPEGICTIGDKVYFGNYRYAELYILDTTKKFYPISKPSDPDNNPRIWGSVGEAQDRPFCLVNAGGKLAMGSVPDYGEFGGALTIYDPETDKAKVMRNIVKDQMIVSIAYKDGKLYCGTSVSGGLGKIPTETDAKIFIYNMETEEVEKIVDLKIPGYNSPIKGVEGISIAPDNTIVGYGRGYIYKLDINTLELLESRLFADSGYGNGAQIWKPYRIHYDKSGYAFIVIDKKLTVLDWKTLDYKVTDTVMSNQFKQGPDGNLYYIGTGYSVCMVPVIRGEDNSYKFIGKTVITANSNKCFSDGEERVIDENIEVTPYIENGKMMVPLRFLAEKSGYKVTYNELEKTAVCYTGDIKIKVSADKKFVVRGDEKLSLAASPVIKNGRIYVHVRTFAELFGKKVYWDESGIVVINNDGTLYDYNSDPEVIQYAKAILGG